MTRSGWFTGCYRHEAQRAGEAYNVEDGDAAI